MGLCRCTTLTGLLTLTLSAQPPSLKAPREWSLPVDQLVQKEEFRALPLLARVYMLRIVDPSLREVRYANTVELAKGADSEPQLNRVPWLNTDSRCSAVYADGYGYKAIKTDGLVVYFRAEIADKMYRAYVGLRNESDRAPNLLTSNISVVFIGKKVTAPTQIPIERAAKAARHGSAWKAALIGGLGGMATKTETSTNNGRENGTYSGSSGSGTYSGVYSETTTTTSPDYEARANSQARARQVLQSGESRGQAVIATALKDNTVRSGQAVGGFVYFPYDGQPVSVIQININGASYEAAFQFNPKNGNVGR